MAEYNSAFDAACCGGPTLHRWTPHPPMEECVVCQRRKNSWPEEFKPCSEAKRCEDFDELKQQIEGE
jgi:hypothetical protein